MLTTCLIFIFKEQDIPNIISIIKDASVNDIATSICIIVTIISFSFAFSPSINNSKFSDIDRNNTTYKKLIEEISKLKDSTEKNKAKLPINERNKYESFHLYFSSIIESLNEQIEIADKKASLLLDKGTSYSRNGIYLYVFIIVLWQAITWFTDLQTRHIYGIASCSLLFVFIEFLSAWFLKQYRHFVDTSTYLIKLRSTLERYILTYLALKEVKANGGNFDPLIDLLKSEIKWPEMAQKGMQDVSAPKELIDSLSNLCSAFKKSN